MAPTSAQDLDYSRRLIQRLDGHQGAVNCVRYNHGAKYVLTASSDRSVRLWNPTLAKEIKAYRGHAQEVLHVDIAHDNAKFASCGGDKTVFVWDVASGTILRRLQGHFGKVFSVVFNKDAQVLASAGFDAKVMLWDMRYVLPLLADSSVRSNDRANTRDPIQTLKDATSSITHVSMPDTGEIITGSLDGYIRAYDLRMGQLTEDLVGHPITSIAPSGNSPRDSLLVSCSDGRLRIFDRTNGSVLQTCEGHKVGEVRNKAVWGYGEGLVLTGDEEGRVWGYNILDGKPIDGKPEAVHKKAITWLEVSPNGKGMVTASTDGTVKFWGK